MNKSHLTNTTIGVTIIIIGIAALLGSIELFNFANIFATWWPLLVILGGVLMLINDIRNYVWGLLFIAAGVLWQLNQFDIVNFSIWQLFWPAIIIAVGISILVNRGGHVTKKTAKSADDVSAILAGINTKNESNDYQGGKVTTIMGGVTLDLRNATIKKEAHLDVFSLMGGLEVKVPEGWVVRSQAMPILGGVENKTISTNKRNAPTLVITGTLCMSGIEVRH